MGGVSGPMRARHPATLKRDVGRTTDVASLWVPLPWMDHDLQGDHMKLASLLIRVPAPRREVTEGELRRRLAASTSTDELRRRLAQR